VDYLQIVESDKREERSKVTDVIARIDELARNHRTVVLAISQMSRASSRAARNGEAIGADSMDGGAESAAIERAVSSRPW
jgi:replicative DNA helicase